MWYLPRFEYSSQRVNVLVNSLMVGFQIYDIIFGTLLFIILYFLLNVIEVYLYKVKKYFYEAIYFLLIIRIMAI